MASQETCVCGHSQASHRTYGCTAWTPNPDPRKTDRIWCQCKAFQSKELLRSSESSRLFKTARFP